MLLYNFLSSFVLTTASAYAVEHPQAPLNSPTRNLFADTPIQDESFSWPSIHESAVMARRILHFSSISNLATTFPTPKAPSDPQTLKSPAQELAGSPISLMEYYADCEPATGNPTFLAIDIATPFRNYAAGSNISMSVRWWPKQTNTYSSASTSSWLSSLFTHSISENDDDDDDIPTPHTPAALPRFSLHGRLEPIPVPELARHAIPACFLKTHPDSALWQPGNDIHTSAYVRLVVEEVYWFGGFGDRARIGWLPVEEWRAVTREEIEGARLPGEGKGDIEVGWKWGL